MMCLFELYLNVWLYYYYNLLFQILKLTRSGQNKRNFEIFKQVYYPIIKFYLLIQIYFFGLRLKCALKTPSVHFPKNDGTEKNAVIESGFKVSYCTLLF